jgi:hypothetical protein
LEPVDQGETPVSEADVAASDHRPPCLCSGGRMIIVETFERGGATPRPVAPLSPGEAEATYDAVDHAKFAPSTAAIAPISPPPSAIRCRFTPAGASLPNPRTVKSP